MEAWVVVGVACAVGFLATVLGLFGGGRVTLRGARPPVWLMPTPSDVGRARFPLTLQGYDPEHVDMHLDAVAAAYEALYLAAGPQIVAQAEERLAARLRRLGGDRG